MKLVKIVSKKQYEKINYDNCPRVLGLKKKMNAKAILMIAFGVVMIVIGTYFFSTFGPHVEAIEKGELIPFKIDDQKSFDVQMGGIHFIVTIDQLSEGFDVKEYFDFVLIDADKENVIEYFDMILPMVSVGGVIITDNMLYPEKYSENMKKYALHIQANQNVRTITSPIGNGEEITVKLR